MNTEELARKLDELYAEYRASGKAIDEYLKMKLGASREDGEAAAEAAIRTFAAIDTKYENLQKAKESGENREDWLRRHLNEALRKSGTNEKENCGAEASPDNGQDNKTEAHQ